MGKVSATPEPLDTLTLPKNPGAEDTANKARLVGNYTGIAYVGERLDAMIQISMIASVIASVLCVSADHQPMLWRIKTQRNFIRIWDDFTPEKLQRFLDLYDNIKAAQDKVF